MSKLKNVAIGLEIFLRHGGEDCAAEHDVLYAGPKDTSKLTMDEISILNEAGWYLNDADDDFWSIFT